MDLTRFPAAGGSLLLNGLILAGLATLATPQTLPALNKPIEVALITPPQPLPTQDQPAARPPEPLPVSNTPPPPPPPRVEPKPKPPKPKPVVKQQPAPTPAPAPVTVATPTEEARPAAITAEPAPPSAPIAPVVAAPPAPPPAPPQKVDPVHEGPRVDASWQGNSPPPYPPLARRMGDQGEVRLDVQVAPDGQVTEVKLKKSSGSSLLDQTAIETVRKWRFKPATVDGRPIAEWYYNWRWVFKLES